MGCNCHAFPSFGGAPDYTKEFNDLTAAGYVVNAPASGNILDAFGVQNRTYVMLGAGALAIAVLVKLIK